jgi:hypothetical protein
VSTGGYDLPRYDFREEVSFEISKRLLDLPDDLIDDHLLAIELQIGPDPFAAPWSVPLAGSTILRVAVSDSTDFSPVALRVIFDVDGDVIRLRHVARR